MKLRVIESSINFATIILLIHKRENVKSNTELYFLRPDLSTGRLGADTHGQPHTGCGDQHTGSQSTAPGPRPRHPGSP